MDGDVLARAAVPGVRVPAALRNQLAGAGIPAEEAARVEAFRVGPQSRVAMVTGHVEEHQRAFGYFLGTEVQVAGGEAADERNERVAAAYLVGEGPRIGAVVRTELFADGGEAVQGVGGEGGEPGDGHGGTQDVEQLHRGGVKVEQAAVGIPVRGHGLQHAVLLASAGGG